MAHLSIDALERRSAQRQAGFLLPLLKSGMSVLDCGCGPGSITFDLARHVAPGVVIGIDAEPAQIERAIQRAERPDNASFQTASVYDLPFETGRFGVVFAHALFQHLRDPNQAISEMHRVLAPGGIIALRSPDWGAIIITPPTPALMSAFKMFIDVYYANGTPLAGRDGPSLLRSAGCQDVTFTATVEHENPANLGQFAAAKLIAPEQEEGAACLRAWAANPDALFAQMWCETVARRSE
jgi:SAM-dependent methyltransferase